MKRILFFIATALLCLQHLPAAAETVSIIADQDACIDKVCPDCFLGGDWRALVSGASGTPAHGLFHFDLSSLPATAQIDNATLMLCVHSKTLVTTYWAYALLKPWEEASATWNLAAAGTPWGKAGGDYDPGRVSTCSLPATAPGWASMDVTALMRDDQGRIRSDIAQHGFVLKSDRSYSKIFTHEFSSFEQAHTCHSCHGALEPERDEGKSTNCAKCHKQGDIRLHGEPTLLVTYTNNVATGRNYRCAALHDTTLEKSAPGLNQGGADGIAISGDAGGTEVARGLLRFNIPPFISAGQIKRAVVYLYSKGAAGSSIKVYPMTAGWFEKDLADPGGGEYLSYGATWNDRGGEDNNTRWDVPGGDCDAASGATVSVAAGWNELDLTAFVNSHLDRLRRFGMQLRAADEAGGEEHELAAREDAEHAPYLELMADLGLGDGEYLCPTFADVYIDAGGAAYPERASQNFNDKTRVLVSWHPSYGAARGLWQFEIPVDIDASRIDNATLCLSGAEHAMNYNKLQIGCYALNKPFNEEEDTWSSLSGGDYDSSIVSSGTLCQEILSVAPINWRARIDVTELLAGNLDKIRTNGMLIKSAREGSLKMHQNMASREAYDATDMAAYLKISITPAASSTTTALELTSTTTTVATTSTTTVDNETSTSTSAAVSSTTSTIDNATSTTTTTTINGTSTTTSTIKDFGSPPRSSSTTTSSVLATSTTSTAAVTTTIPEPLPETTTTSTVALGPCPIEQVLAGRQDKLDLLRRLRDERMTTSKTGLLLVTLYYTYGVEVSRILNQQPELQAAAAECLEELLPAVQAGLQSGRPIVIMPEQYARAMNVLRGLQAAGTTGLPQVISYALKELESGELLDVAIIQSRDN